MLAVSPSADDIGKALAEQGLSLRGGWQPDLVLDRLPLLPGGQSAGVVWLVGVVGAAHWASFAASSFFSDGLPDPLDRWSRAVGDALAARELHPAPRRGAEAVSRPVHGAGRLT